MNSSPSQCTAQFLHVKHRTAFLAVFLFLFLGLSLHAFGQEATIVGTITDPSGAAVPNVTVTITHVETGNVRTTVTNESGQYVAPGLPIGHYNISASASGFGVSERQGLVLNVNDRTRVDFAMKVGTAKEQVTVEANAVQVQSDTSDVSSVITGQQVHQLSTNGRSVYSLFSLTPGAASLQGDLITPTPVSGDSNVSINGQRAGHNLQILDGGENLDRGGSSGSVMPSIDAIAEFRNMTSNYSAEYGLAGAATITTAIKSGTSTFHASAWEFFRNDALDARGFFNPAPQHVQELRFNVYGFNVGGQLPWWKEHPTFFFYNMEWRSIVNGGSTNQVVPDSSTYLGDFTNALPADKKDPGGNVVLHSGLRVPCLNQLSDDQITAFNNAGITTFSTPNSAGGCSIPTQAQWNDGVTDPTFVGYTANTLPFLDQNGQALLHAGGKFGGIFPANNSVNGAGQPQFHGGNNSPTTVREEITRVDHTFNSKFSIFGHFVAEQISQTYGTTQWSGDNVPTVSNIFGNPSYSGVVHTTYVASPTLLNEVAFNYNGNRINIIPQGLVTAPDNFTFNRLFTGPNVDTRIPAINLNGGTGTQYTSNWTPWINKADDYQIRDDLSWTKGPHQLKFGFSWALYKKVQDWFAVTQGQFQFNGSFTGNDFADYLLGYSSQYQEDAVKSSGNWNNVSWAAYAQDNWRVNRRLTLNLGLRWDGAPHTYEANQHSANFYPGMYDQNAKATFNNAGHICSGPSDPEGGCTAQSPGLGPSPDPILAGLLFYTNGIGIGGINAPKGLTHNYWANFGPRIGFAYDVTGQGKTVVRGGFGILYDRVQGNDMYNGATNTPFDASPTLHAVSLSNPGVSITNNTPPITAQDLPILPVNQTGIDINYHPPTTYQYSFGVQQSLGARTVFGLSYVGSQSRHQNDYRAVNLPDITHLPALIGGTGNINTDPTLAFPGFGGIRLAENEGNARYNSLQLDLRGNVTRDLQLQAGYTWAKAIDATTSNGSGGDLNNLTNPFVGWKYDSGPSVFDRAHVFFTNFVYQIPLFRNTDNRALKIALGGWEVSGIITAQTGAPLNIGLNGQNASSIIGNTGNRPDRTGNISYPKKVGEWFDTSAFAAPGCVTGPDCYGDLGHNNVRGPGRDNWNLSLFKSFLLSESRGSRIEFRAESFNTWNHTQFKGDYNQGGIGTNFGSGNFGVISGAYDPRVFQLGLKVIF